MNEVTFGLLELEKISSLIAPWKSNGFAKKSLDLGKFLVSFGIPYGRQLTAENGLIFGLGKLMFYCYN